MCVFRIFEISTNPLSLISFQPGQVRQRSSSPAAGKLSVTFSAKHRMAVSQNPGPLRNIFRNIWFMDVYISPMVIIGFDPSLCHGGKLYNYTVYNICNIYIYIYIYIYTDSANNHHFGLSNPFPLFRDTGHLQGVFFGRAECCKNLVRHGLWEITI